MGSYRINWIDFLDFSPETPPRLDQPLHQMFRFSESHSRTIYLLAIGSGRKPPPPSPSPSEQIFSVLYDNGYKYFDYPEFSSNFDGTGPYLVRIPTFLFDKMRFRSNRIDASGILPPSYSS